MGLKRQLGLVGIAVALAAPMTRMPAHAEPDSAVSKLMATPVSMFDFGLYKLNRYFDRQDQALESYGFHANYDSISNQITIAGLSNRLFDKNECERMIRLVKTKGLVGENQETFGPSSYFSLLFSPSFKTDMLHSGLLAQLDKIIEIKVYMGDGLCRSMLLSPEILYSEE